jgi:hypothetical protein
MKRNIWESAALVLLLVSAQLEASTAEGFAQAALTAKQAIALRTRNYTSKAVMHAVNATGWQEVATVCTTVNPACSHAAIVEVSTECGADAQLFTKDSKKWQVAGFVLVVASAAFTGAGSAATIAGSTTIPKVFSTLGGTTGLGAVTTSANAVSTSDQGGITTLNTVLTSFLKFVQTGGANNAAPTDLQIYQSAPIYAAQCEAAASSSTASK